MDLRYRIVPLETLLKSYDGDERQVQKMLSDFECLNNADVERFLKEKALLFNRQGLSKTHLLYTSYKGEYVLVGYFALANKSFVVKDNSAISKSLKKRIAKFGKHSAELKQYIITAPLIGQLGKNDKYRDLISGDVLLKYACDEIRKAQMIVGGKFVYLECEDKPRLKEFYSDNGFVAFGKRALEADEKDDLSGTYLIQMLKYLK